MAVATARCGRAAGANGRKPDIAVIIRPPTVRTSRAGIGIWIEPEPVMEGPVLAEGDRGDTVAELQYLLADYGYGIEVLGRYDETTKAVVAAFQRHFRPEKVDGVADVSTVATLRRLLDTVKSAA